MGVIKLDMDMDMTAFAIACSVLPIVALHEATRLRRKVDHDHVSVEYQEPGSFIK